MHPGHQQQTIRLVELRILRVLPGMHFHVSRIFQGHWVFRVPHLKFPTLYSFIKLKNIYITKIYPSFEQVAKNLPLCEKLTCST